MNLKLICYFGVEVKVWGSGSSNVHSAALKLSISICSIFYSDSFIANYLTFMKIQMDINKIQQKL